MLGKGGGFNVGGGTIGTAESMAAMAANAFAPGSGQAAQIAMQEANRFAAYLGQVAGIGVEGLAETFRITDPDGGSIGGKGGLARLPVV